MDSPPSPGGSSHPSGASTPRAALAASSFDSASALSGLEAVRTPPLHPPLFDSRSASVAAPYSPRPRLSAFDPALAVLAPSWLAPVAPIAPAEGLYLDLPASGVAQGHVRASPPDGCVSLDSPQSPAGSALSAGGSPPRAALAAPPIDDGESAVCLRLLRRFPRLRPLLSGPARWLWAPQPDRVP